MTDYKFCCEKCFYDLMRQGHVGIKACNVWMNLCKMFAAENRVLMDILQDWKEDSQYEALCLLEEQEYLLTADMPRGVRVKMYGFISDELCLKFCACGGDHDEEEC